MPEASLPSAGGPDALLQPGAAAARLRSLALALRDLQLGFSAARCGDFGGVCFEPGGPPSVGLTAAAVWAWGAAQRACVDDHAEAGLTELCCVARAAAWAFLRSWSSGYSQSSDAVLVDAVRVAEFDEVTQQERRNQTDVEAALIVLAAASEQLLGDGGDEEEALAAVADGVLKASLAASLRPGGRQRAGAAPPSWLLLPLLLHAHCVAASSSPPAGAHGSSAVAALAPLAAAATAFPSLPPVWWDQEAPADGSVPSGWAGCVVTAIVAHGGSQELVPWAARCASAALPRALTAPAPAAPAPEGVSTARTVSSVRDASLLMALHALRRAVPHATWGGAARRAAAVAATLGGALAADADAEQQSGTGVVRRLALAFAVYGLSVEPHADGGRVCC